MINYSRRLGAQIRTESYIALLLQQPRTINNTVIAVDFPNLELEVTKSWHYNEIPTDVAVAQSVSTNFGYKILHLLLSQPRTYTILVRSLGTVPLVLYFVLAIARLATSLQQKVLSQY